ncbi:hypothetical protein LXL04_007439 [Taraxacum kok-saghyz]
MNLSPTNRRDYEHTPAKILCYVYEGYLRKIAVSVVGREKGDMCVSGKRTSSLGSPWSPNQSAESNDSLISLSKNFKNIQEQIKNTQEHSRTMKNTQEHMKNTIAFRENISN